MTSDEQLAAAKLAADWRKRAERRDELVKTAREVTETSFADHRADAFRTCAAELESLIVRAAARLL